MNSLPYLHTAARSLQTERNVDRQRGDGIADAALFLPFGAISASQIGSRIDAQNNRRGPRPTSCLRHPPFYQRAPNPLVRVHCWPQFCMGLRAALTAAGALFQETL